MIRFRSFLNSDPPAICEIWRNQPPARGLMQPMTPSVLEQLVFSRPYFDRQGFIVAVADQFPVGFAHAAFGPEQSGGGLNYDVGVTCLLMVSSEGERSKIAAGLLAESEAYLQGYGATELCGGCIGPGSPFFYQGLYGGATSPGVLGTDTLQIEMYLSAGYTERSRCVVWQRELSGFRPVVDRQLIRLRRQFSLSRATTESTPTWWHACTLGQLDLVRFELMRGGDEGPVGRISFWDIEPLATTWGVHAMSLVELHIESPEPRELVSTFILGEALRQLQLLGASVVELQVNVTDHPLLSACERLGFSEVDRGVEFGKAG